MAKVVLAGGGTGGHVYPALAIGRALQARGHEVIYFGDPQRLEGRVAPEQGLQFVPVHAPQYPRGGVAAKLAFGVGLLRSVLRCWLDLRRVGADVVLGVGGYISAPPVLAAWLSRRPRVVHEANVVPGLANRLCARVADAVLLTYASTSVRLPFAKDVTVVGVPVNQAIVTGERASAANRYGLDASQPVVVFVGGSLGAARINELAIGFAKHDSRNAQVLHLCGQRYHDEVLAAYGELPAGVTLVSYEDRMQDAYAVADVVVCRAGSSTLAELCAVGVASILIPSPNVTENHQEHNARGLVEDDAARMIVEEGWDLAASVGVVSALLDDEAARRAMGEAALGLAKMSAAEHAADIVERTLR